VLAAMIHLNRGTPFIYMGEEIGMLNPTYDTIDAFDDIESKNAYQMLIAKGKSASEALAIVQSKSRDNARIPMQWQTANNGGFTKGTPWLAPGDYANISVEQERKNPQIFGFYQRLIQLRKMYPIIAEGSYQGYEKNHSQVFSFIRELGNQKLVVMNNLSATNATIALPDEFLAGQVLISNQETQVMKDMTLMPYQTVAILI
jgi:trehalose-6-phosphate hydrolase